MTLVRETVSDVCIGWSDPIPRIALGPLIYCNIRSSGHLYVQGATAPLLSSVVLNHTLR